MKHVGVIDIGKTDAKVAVVDLSGRRELAVETRPNTVLPAPPWPHFDTEGLWSFVIGSLARLHAAHRIAGISVTTHGACAALLDKANALAAPVIPAATRAARPTMRSARPLPKPALHPCR